MTTVLEAILHHARTRPADPAVSVEADRLTWAAFADAIAAFHARAARAGVGPGDRVAILSRPGLSGVTAYFGAIAAGAASVPMPVSLRPDALARLLADCDPALIVVDGASAALLDGTDHDRPVVELDVPCAPPPGGLRPVAMPPEALFNIIYSSGTTGQPKGIMHDHAMRNAQSARGVFGLDPLKRMLLSTPLYSNTTLVPMLAAVHEGAEVRLMSKFDAGDWLRQAAKWRATHTMLVPVQYRRLLDHPDFDRTDLSAMELKQSTSAPLDLGLKTELLGRFPGRLLEVYGLTEGGVSSVLDATRNPGKLDTVGQPIPGADLRIIDAEDRELPRGETGEIVGRSPFMMRGYWARPDLSDDLKWHDGEGRAYFRSGDLGRFDDEGFLRIVGRRKEMINSGGFNIYPVDLEAVLTDHPDVDEAAVFAIPSPRWGETPFAAVVLKGDATHDGTTLLDWANARLGPMQRIHAVAIRTELPRSSIGKVAKAALAEEYKDRGTP